MKGSWQEFAATLGGLAVLATVIDVVRTRTLWPLITGALCLLLAWAIRAKAEGRQR